MSKIRNGGIDALIRNNANSINLLEPDYNVAENYTGTFEDIVGNEHGDCRVQTILHSSNEKAVEVTNFTDKKTMKMLCDMGLRAGLFVVDGVTYNVIVLGSSEGDPLNRKWAESVSI